jgi:hypothetical protein
MPRLQRFIATQLSCFDSPRESPAAESISRKPYDIQEKTAQASEQDREDVKERRETWLDGQLDLDPEKLASSSTRVCRRGTEGVRYELMPCRQAA